MSWVNVSRLRFAYLSPLYGRCLISGRATHGRKAIRALAQRGKLGSTVLIAGKAIAGA